MDRRTLIGPVFVDPELLAVCGLAPCGRRRGRPFGYRHFAAGSLVAGMDEEIQGAQRVVGEVFAGAADGPGNLLDDIAEVQGQYARAGEMERHGRARPAAQRTETGGMD